jgi:hypothetical protein
MGGVQPESKDIESCCRGESQLPPIGAGTLVIDIHWGIAPSNGPMRIDAADLWHRARPATIAGVEVLGLSAEDLLLHLCVHVCYQHFLEEGLRSFSDIAETIHRYRDEIDWPQVVARAREWGASRYVGLALHLAESMLRAGVPEAVLEQLVPGGLDQRLLETARRSALAKTGDLRSVSLVDRWAAMSITDKARLSLSRIFLSRDEMTAVYPASSDSKRLGYYYALRLRDVIRTFGTHVLGRGLRAARSRGQASEAELVNWLKSGKP